MTKYLIYDIFTYFYLIYKIKEIKNVFSNSYYGKKSKNYLFYFLRKTFIFNKIRDLTLYPHHESIARENYNKETLHEKLKKNFIISFHKYLFINGEPPVSYDNLK